VYDVEEKKYDLYKESIDKTVFLEPIKKTKFKEGDVVRVIVKNYNPFKYKVIIKQKEVRQQVNSEASLMEGALGILGKASVLGDFLMESNLPLGNSKGYSSRTRGGEEEPTFKEALFSKPENLTEYNSFKKQFQNDYTNYLSLNREAEEIAKKMSQSNLTSKESFQFIKDSLLLLRDKVSSVNFQQILSEAQLTKNAFRNSEFKFNLEKAYESIKKSTPNAKDEQISAAYREFLNDYQIVTQQYEALKEMNDPTKRVTVDKINDLINAINRAEYSTEKVYVVHTDSEKSLKSASQDGILSALDFEVELYDLSKFDAILNKEDEVRLYIRIPNMEKYVNGYGEIVDKPCENCTPLTKAEGMITGEDIPTFDDIEGNDCESCVGKWTIYNDEGEVERIITPPQITIVSGTPSSLQNKIELADGESIETALVMKKSLEMPVAGAIGLNWSTGLFGISPFSGRKIYREEQDSFGDSISIRASKLSPINISLGTLMSIEFLSRKSIIPSINLGVSVDISEEQNVNYLLGFSIKPKNFQLLSFGAGISFAKVNALNNQLEVGKTYSLQEYNDMIDSDEPFSKQVYKPGFYFGLGLNF
jgi:hypothetical protein